MLECQAGTKMNASYCQPIMSALWMNRARLEPAPHVTWANQTQSAALCACPPHRNGTDCALVRPPRPQLHETALTVCERHETKTEVEKNQTAHTMAWDGSFLNTNLNGAKHIECFMTDRVPFKVNDHRLNMTITPTQGAPGKLDVRFQMLQRRRMDHPEGQTQENVKQMGGCNNFTDKSGVSASANCYFPRHSEIDCTSTSCTAAHEPSDYDPTKTQVHYKCEKSKCTTFQGLETVVRGALALVQRLDFVFINVDTSQGTATAWVNTGTGVTMEMGCNTGQCIPSNQTAPKNQPRHKNPVSLALATGVILLLALVVCPALGVVYAIRVQRRPKTDAVQQGRTGALTSPRLVTVVFEAVTYDVPGARKTTAEQETTGREGRGCMGQVTAALGCAGGRAAQMRRVLQETTGLVRPGELCALMGPSGAGKSSLLDIIAQQPKQGQIHGQTCFVANGKRVPKGEIRRLCRYVMQDDRLMPTETVEEALQFAAEMTLPWSVTSAEIDAKVDEVLTMLELQHIRGSRIGGHGFAGGLSGGERRRVSVGVELIADPAVLLLDEPTSGLDAVSADVVMRCLRRAVDTAEMTCLLTIHQPSAEIYALFDSVCLLGSKGGHAFFGSRMAAAEAVASARHTIQTVRSTGGEPVQLNPAEELLRYGSTGPAACEAFAQSEGRQQLLVATAAAFDCASRPIQSDGQVQKPGALYERPPGLFAQFWWLVLRGGRQVVRDPNLMFLQVGVTASVGLITGLLFYRPGL
eukprot:SAG31_NODE_3501_length_4192_cov_1.943562_3_plen_751_part_01